MSEEMFNILARMPEDRASITAMTNTTTYAQGYRDGQDAYRAGLANKPVGPVGSQHYACGFFDGYRDLAEEIEA